MKIAIIPARSGSKRIKNKNIVNFFGKPLIYYAIKKAIESKIFDYVVVSTDKRKIANIAIKYGAQVPFLRPLKFSTDKSSCLDTVKHCLKWFVKKGIFFKYVCMIYPTAPLIKISDLKKGSKMITSNKADFCFTAAEFPSPILRSFHLNKKNFVKKTLSKKNFKKNSQNLPKYYFDAGQFYWGKSQAWLKTKMLIDKRCKIISIPDFMAIDLNDKNDLEKLKLFYKSLNK